MCYFWMMLRVYGCVNEDPGPCQGPDVHRITMNFEDFIVGEFAILFDFRFRNLEPAVDEYQYHLKLDYSHTSL